MEQGPFSKEQLRQWRTLLPMDLPLWHAAEARPPSEAERRRPIELARVLEDGKLLERWREQNPGHAGTVCAAPTAAQFEADQMKDTATSLAEAVLAGLPANDEAVQVARLAASTGKSIQEARPGCCQTGGGLCDSLAPLHLLPQSCSLTSPQPSSHNRWWSGTTSSPTTTLWHS